jgi:Glycosyl transferase family 2
MTISASAPARAAGAELLQNGPIDIVMLTHDRLDHLVAGVDALEANTPEPYRLTIVDNASGPELRNWLAENAHRFERVILRPTNEHVPGFQHGIDATVSDPYIVTDPDVVVPACKPSWLARLLDLMARHPDFGLIGLGLDQANRPDVLPPEVIDPEQVVDGEIVEAGVGTIFQLIRRRALVTAYRSDGEACTDVRRAGWRVGWAPGLRGVHLGWDDFTLHPGHLAGKEHQCYPAYHELGLIRRPPSLSQLATASPALAEVGRLGVPNASILEVTWSGPAVGAVVPEAVTVAGPADGRLPLDHKSAAGVVLVDPPEGSGPELLVEACRVATRAVVAIAPLTSFPGRTAADLAPAGWTGHEAPGPNDLVARLAAAGDENSELAARLRAGVLEEPERWRELFGAAAFGAAERRLWIWERPARAVPDRVEYDPERLERWHPELLERHVQTVGKMRTQLGRLDLARRALVVRGRLRWWLRDRRARAERERP